MKPNSLSLALKFSIAVTMLIIISMLGVATLIINYQKEALKQNTFENNIAMTKNLAHDAAEPLLIFDPLRLNELVATLSEANSSAYAMIIDREGQIVAHTKRSLLGSRITENENHELIRHLSKGENFVREYIYENEPVREFSHPISIGSEVLGLATVAFSVSTIDMLIGESLEKLKEYIYMITALMLLTGIAGAFIVSNYLTKPLKRLKDRMLDVQSGNLDVQVENPGIVKCWERLNCEKKDCPSFGRTRCWAIAGTFCRGEVQGVFAQKIGDCRNCVVYKESCGDEIQELVEVFNQMLKDLKFNLDQLEKVNSEKAHMERLSALGEMASTVAHETKNPLNAIKIATTYLKNNFHGEILSEFLTIIEEEVTRLNEISYSFLSFSKPPPLNLKPCNINAVIETTVNLIRQEATERNIEIIVLKDENLPLIPCDFSSIKQAVLNLLINAMDVSQAGDTISITTEAVDSHLHIAIQDTGKGIKDEDIGNIFKPFYSTKTRGAGLGLSIVERIVKEHGGEIRVDSVIGKGTKFTIKMMLYEHAKT
ncbi:MAG: HAMP domain-containing protein [Nitrospiraceae bacterium]|nr:MAG: HAMP domain-containing protein [Nitrospiraceae bacterium]